MAVLAAAVVLPLANVAETIMSDFAPAADARMSTAAAAKRNASAEADVGAWVTGREDLMPSSVKSGTSASNGALSTSSGSVRLPKARRRDARK